MRSRQMETLQGAISRKDEIPRNCCYIIDDAPFFQIIFNLNGEYDFVELQLDLDRTLIMQFLKLGTGDLEKLKSACIRSNMPIPTEMKMCYDVKTEKYNAQYKYEEVCSEKTGKNAGEVFTNWIKELEG
ncbi:MAG: hypothetical protein K2H52_06350 [Lachnospiraceae bacterium]|nr:hypothetical protein [Lachnospiraceae bacterium]